MANGFDQHHQDRRANKLVNASYLYNGVNYVSIYAACEAAGADYSRVRRRMAQGGWTLQQAIDAPTYARTPLGAAGSTLAAMQAVLNSTPRGMEDGAVKAITRLGALYLKEIAHVQDKP